LKRIFVLLWPPMAGTLQDIFRVRQIAFNLSGVVMNATCAGNLTARGDDFAAGVFGLRDCLPSSWRKRRLTGLVKNYGPARNRIKMNVCHFGIPFLWKYLNNCSGREIAGHD